MSRRSKLNFDYWNELLKEFISNSAWKTWLTDHHFSIINNYIDPDSEYNKLSITYQLVNELIKLQISFRIETVGNRIDTFVLVTNDQALTGIIEQVHNPEDVVEVLNQSKGKIDYAIDLLNLTEKPRYWAEKRETSDRLKWAIYDRIHYTVDPEKTRVKGKIVTNLVLHYTAIASFASEYEALEYVTFLNENRIPLK